MLYTVFTIVTFLSLLQIGSFYKIKIPVGGIFEGINQEEEIAFKAAIDVVNEENLLPNYELEPISFAIEPENVTAKKGGDVIDIAWDIPYVALKATCNLLEKGVAAIFTNLYDDNANTVQSICDSKEVPVIRTVPDKLQERECFSLDFFPNVPKMARAFADLVSRWNWHSFTILYETQDTFESLSEILKIYNSSGQAVVLHYLYQTEKGNYRNALKELRKSGQTNLVLHCEAENLHDILYQAQQIGFMTKKYSFVIVNIEIFAIDLDLYKDSEVNMTSLTLIDPASADVLKIGEAMQNKQRELGLEMETEDLRAYSSHRLTTTYLMVDAIMHFVETMKQIGYLEPRSLLCKTADSWEHGSTIFNFMKTVSIKGLSGLIQFDYESIRSNFTLNVVELTEEGLTKIGTWSTTNGLNIIRTPPSSEEEDETSLKNIHLRVLIAWSDPYAFFKNSTSPLFGNEQFGGFVIDLIQELSKMEGFTYTFIRNEDDKNGDFNETTGQWNGMIGDLLDGKGDIAIGDLAITRDRLKVVEFTTPFMSLGIQILYSKPTKGTPDFFSFAAPFAPEVWLWFVISFFGVSLGLYMMARVCRSEWYNWDRCVQNPDYVLNQMNMRNSLWYVTGSLMQQGTDIAPRGASTRVLSSVWAFFILIMVSYYKASLAAFLTTEVKISAFNDAKELVSRADKLGIRYGAVANEATHKFFQNADLDLYKEIGRHMDAHPENMVDEIYAGVLKVLNENYAFFSESVTIKFIVNEECKLTSVGDLLDEKYYAIALPKGSLYEKRLSSAILQLQQLGVIDSLERKWWEEIFADDPCGDHAPVTLTPPLNNYHVAGIFWITFGGIFLACICVFVELGLHILKVGVRNRQEFIAEYKRELWYSFNFSREVKSMKNGRTVWPSTEDIEEKD